MCSKCYKETAKSESNKSGDAKPSSASPNVSSSEASSKPASSISNNTTTATRDSTPSTDGAVSHQQDQPRVSRKHARSPSPIAKERDSSLQIPSPLSQQQQQASSSNTSSSTTTPISSTQAASPDSSAASTPTATSERPQQVNKGRCFRCRVKVPLAKQTINKCRCEYVFCDSHRYPDRHDCEVDFAKLDRDTLAKNNPKLHERPKGGRSFQRIDSL
ncbi:hypothetical protein BDB00DRAFT_792614 [Zychaea mexicana]|uniref:uncharacterized protein n=1 Tax=Zychaea mexicana TaxID=64656 RepID=UPI0022FF33DD|nr:uncharacterized protein BDB00DRAFT_792614 [Zychaea mexicana]KAI9484758.1 hypothetical protein BDB00DRAFT_792614 [Zychaea mexicana]